MRCPSQQSDWEGLLKDLLELIFLRLRHAADLIRIGAVCRKWHSTINTLKHKHLCPVLLLDNDRNSAVYDLFDFAKNKTHGTQLYPTLQVHHRHHLFRYGCYTNSCNGWLVRMDHYSIDSWPIYLINPFTGVKIQLPPLTTFEEDPLRARVRIKLGFKRRFLLKAVLPSTPLDPSCVVVAIYRRKATYTEGIELKLALCSPRDTTWKALKSDQATNFFVDVIYFMDHFYALGRSKELFRCDINSDDEPKVVRISLPEPLLEPDLVRAMEPEPELLLEKELEWTRLCPHGQKSRPYLVDWCGFLLMVVRYTVFDIYILCKTARFKVFKFDFDRGRWDEINSLGGGSIFVSYSGMAVLSIKEDFPQFKPNCIYFTDDNHAKGGQNLRDTGVFCLSTKVCKPWRVMAGMWPPPFLWISPDLCSSVD